MWSGRRIKDSSFLNSINCPECNESSHTLPLLDYEWNCENCHKNERHFKFRCNNCESQYAFCMACSWTSRIKRYKGIDQSQRNNSQSVSEVHLRSDFTIFCKIRKIVVFSSFLVLLSVYLFFVKGTKVTLVNENVEIINKLRKLYPSQKNETWYHFVSVLEKENPSVKSITFLHGEDKKTAERLTNELVSLYTENKSIKSEEITFSTFENEEEDYGIVLEHYRQIVKRFRVFITNLNRVNGNTARIFHSLCDEVSSDIKPSLFIFTLMYNKRTEDLKLVERATTILKGAWNDLPENEISPLLSRIVKNVIDVVPEKENTL